MLRNDLLEFGDDVSVAAELEVRVDSLFERKQTALLDARDLRLSPRLERKIVERAFA